MPESADVAAGTTIDPMPSARVIQAEGQKLSRIHPMVHVGIMSTNGNNSSATPKHAKQSELNIRFNMRPCSGAKARSESSPTSHGNRYDA
eukprot:CAMPEP_0172882656 /NCGR_PEP_ID=MMETSP1075-20121228/120653_1 /TAXON_ID=2916 /ORGANISM="Ceratium fusus, Strain PA161109" /LENGTH=89 /DNA_ID=CAMNT_0013735365 /DNA_START=117 /DNA_END=383 /DNA_ORIENTATION=+